MNFVIYAECDIIYNGRGYSTLERGNYLIIYKDDASLSIHGSTKVLPRNYQSEGTKLTVTDTLIEAKRKSEIK
jgi:RecB family endonuclease NucS